MNKIDKYLNDTVFLDTVPSNFKIIYEVLDKVHEKEKKINLLFEKKGVAMYNFRSEIRDIVDYILKMFYLEYKKIKWVFSKRNLDGKEHSFFKNEKNIEFYVPKEITKKVNFIKDLTIKVDISCIFDNEINGSIERASNSIVKPNNLNLFRRKLKNSTILCNLTAVNGVLSSSEISRTLYHELGHYFQDFNLQKNNDSLYKRTKRDSYYKNKNIFDSSENIYIRKIGDVLYSLFNKTELSQLASGVYGELVELNPSLKDLNAAISQTKTYERYKYLIRVVDELSNLESYETWNAAKTFYRTKSHKNGYTEVSVDTFKDKFIKLSIKYLGIFYRKMMNAVELYYDEKNI